MECLSVLPQPARGWTVDSPVPTANRRHNEQKAGQGETQGTGKKVKVSLLQLFGRVLLRIVRHLLVSFCDQQELQPSR
jgi:hypothetical protein